MATSISSHSGVLFFDVSIIIVISVATPFDLIGSYIPLCGHYLCAISHLAAACQMLG